MSRHSVDVIPEGEQRRPIAGLDHWHPEGRHAPRHRDYRPRVAPFHLPDPPTPPMCEWSPVCTSAADEMVRDRHRGAVLACSVHAELAALVAERYGHA